MWPKHKNKQVLNVWNIDVTAGTTYVCKLGNNDKNSANGTVIILSIGIHPVTKPNNGGKNKKLPAQVQPVNKWLSLAIPYK